VLENKQVKSIISRKEMLEHKYPDINIRFGSPFNCIDGHSYSPCSAGDDKLLISPTGEVFPCEAFKFMRGNRPTIYDHTLSDLWYGDQLLNNIRKFKEQVIKDCKNCPRLDFCSGGCPGQRMLRDHSITRQPDPLCIYQSPEVII
jgi:radical SAM protein with 4Fe4S-binding SPASM domain